MKRSVDVKQNSQYFPAEEEKSKRGKKNRNEAKREK